MENYPLIIPLTPSYLEHCDYTAQMHRLTCKILCCTGGKVQFKLQSGGYSGQENILGLECLFSENLSIVQDCQTKLWLSFTHKASLGFRCGVKRYLEEKLGDLSHIYQYRWGELCTANYFFHIFQITNMYYWEEGHMWLDVGIVM